DWTGRVVVEQGPPDAVGDEDGDGVGNRMEQVIGSDPIDPDTDSDGVWDGEEVEVGADPLDGSDGGDPESTCWFMVTIGGHLPWGCANDPGTVATDLRPLNGVAFNDDKRPNVWTVTITGTGAGSVNGRSGSVSIGTGEYGLRRIEYVRLKRGACYEVSLSFGGFVPASGGGWGEHHAYFAGLTPVDVRTPDRSRGGVPAVCAGCCCHVIVNPAGSEGPFPGGVLGNHCWTEPGTYPGVDGRTVLLCLPVVDLDIDSDNSEGLVGEARFTVQDERLERGDRPGGMKVVLVNREDADGDRVLDFADGFDHDPTLSDDDQSPGARFTPIQVCVKGLTAEQQATATITLGYDGAHPADMVVTTRQLDSVTPDTIRSIRDYSAGEGLVRVWRRNGDVRRSINDYVVPNHPYPIEELLGGGSSVVLYVEAVNGSAESAPITVSVAADPPLGCVMSSSVRVLPLDPVTGLSEDEVAGYRVIRALSSEVVGTNGNDILIGRNNPPGDVETIHALGGDDIILAGGGDDVIHCGPGRDLVFSWRGSKNIHLDPAQDRVSYMAGNVLAAAPLTNHQVDPPETTPEPGVPPRGASAAPFTPEDVRSAYVWAFGADDAFLRAFEHPDNGGEILVVPSYSGWRGASLTSGTHNLDRLDLGGWGESAVHKYVLKIEYSAGNALSAAVGMRQSILSEMLPRDFEAFFFELTASQRTDPTEWNLVYGSWNEMRAAQLQKVIGITKVMVSVYVSAWFAAAGPAGEIIEAVVEVSDALDDNREAISEAFEFLSLLPGKALGIFDDTQGEFLDDLTPPGGGGGILPPDDDPEEPTDPPAVSPGRLFAKLNLRNASAILKGDVVRIRLGNNAYATKGFVLRRDMPVRVVARADGSSVLLVGKAQQVTGPADAHVRTINRLADEMAQHGRILSLGSMPTRNYLYIGMNRSVRTMVANGQTGARFESCSRKRPDLTGLWIDAQGRSGVDMFEVASGGQDRVGLTAALDQVMRTLPQGVTRGVRESFNRDP
ncbi:MAG: hypothetical protein ACK4WH_14705, partial [Phycisphaerales bacterium]